MFPIADKANVNTHSPSNLRLCQIGFDALHYQVVTECFERGWEGFSSTTNLRGGIPFDAY